MSQPDHPINEAIRAALARAREKRPPSDVVPTEGHSPTLGLRPGQRVAVTVPGEVLEDADGNPIGVEENDSQEYVVGSNGVLSRIGSTDDDGDDAQ